MRVLFRRVFGVLSAFALIGSSLANASAQSSDTVDVTGSIVAAPLSITISTETVSFGSIDYRATSQGSSPSATGFLANANDGTLWVANTPVSISISSPSQWSATACVSVSSGLPTAGLYNLNAMPADASAANTAFAQSHLYISTCGSASAWTSNNNAGDPTLSRYLGTWVQKTDTPRAFTATVQFSVSNS